jgi:hypothetical protein
MNSQLPPIDRDLRAHLARRSAGRAPEDLLTATYAALDVAPSQPRRLTWRLVPRMAVAGSALALTAILAAVLLVVPRSGVGPATSGQWGYPADRALTSPELALVMAGPALPANTALVANVVIGIRSDVCPMDRYPTVGVVEGMNSQVCVMAGSLSAIPPGQTATGTFAFRYLAPGYLGLLGEITPASPARVAFRVADDWPLQGKTFLVDGWLGAEGLVYPCASVAAGDVLSPNGEDCPNDNWLSDDPSAPLVGTSVPIGPQSTGDALQLHGNARVVEAGGMRQIDSIDRGAPIHGVYVVRSVTEGCPGDPPQTSRGCSAWRVLARVAEISIPAPSGTPLEVATAAPTTAPPATPLSTSLTGVIGTGNQPLSVDELETLMVTQPDHLAGRIVIVEAPIPTQISCQSDANGGGCAVNTKPLAGDGVWAVGIGADGALSLIGQIATSAAGGYVFTLEEVNASTSLKAGDSLIVDGWLLEYIVTCDFSATPLPAGCGPYSTIASTASDNSPATFYVQRGAFEEFTGSAGDWTVEGPPVQGLFLVRVTNTNGGTLLARLEIVTP